MMKLTAALAVALVVAANFAAADIYMHNPRGSNDRNCERNQNRNNGNRLFDSQNNDKGGYACPRAVGGPEVETPTMYYYAGSKLRVEWTNQHACGSNPNVECDVVLQYMCAPEEEVLEDDPMYDVTTNWLRDGTPEDANDAATDRVDSPEEAEDPRFGYHETYNYYMGCLERDRNGGLYIADRNLNNNIGATATRQNNNGARRGLECPEERDYYPYWHPSPWKDIAVLTHKPSRCSYYKRESQNVQDKFWCKTDDNEWAEENSEAACRGAGHNWVEVPAWKIPAPECRMSEWARDNHLGNGYNGETPSYMWTLPKYMDYSARCTLRIRYNISTGDVNWDLDHLYNGASAPMYQDPMAHIAGHDDDPTTNWENAVNVSLAVNTNQYGRTFQDRSYVFEIRKRNDGSDVSGDIWNLNVRGKRGNIVQTYPSVEYDFVPTHLDVAKGDYVHFQWTGSDYNPNRNPNDGEGGPKDPVDAGNDGNYEYRADRHNIVPVRARTLVPRMIDPTVTPWFGTLSKEQMVSLAYINQDLSDCWTLEALYEANDDDKDEVDKDEHNCMKLNAARTPYFDMDPVKMDSAGTYHYMSTRNNNFSNRSQRGTVRVSDGLSEKEKIAIGAGAAVGGAAAIIGASVLWAKKNPNGSVAGVLSKTPLVN